MEKGNTMIFFCKTWLKFNPHWVTERVNFGGKTSRSRIFRGDQNWDHGVGSHDVSVGVKWQLVGVCFLTYCVSFKVQPRSSGTGPSKWGGQDHHTVSLAVTPCTSSRQEQQEGCSTWEWRAKISLQPAQPHAIRNRKWTEENHAKITPAKVYSFLKMVPCFTVT